MKNQRVNLKYDKKKGLRVKLEFEFNLDEEVPVLDFIVPLKTKEKKDKINIVKPKRNARDTSTNSRLF